jgi:hypothetical protein
MQLGTFGAIMGFAMSIEDRSAAFFEQAARAEMAATFASLARESSKRRKRLERARRELVSEMILESITGLDGEDYQVTLNPRTADSEVLRQALAMEETAARYYRDAAAKMPIREVVRLFERLARENDRRQAQLVECRQHCGL